MCPIQLSLRVHRSDGPFNSLWALDACRQVTIRRHIIFKLLTYLLRAGFKNGTDGSIGIAVDAIRAAQTGHVFLSVTKQGLSAIVETQVRHSPCEGWDSTDERFWYRKGNDCCHVILRGSNSGPNYSQGHVEDCVAKLQKAGLNPRIMIDASHGNSEKKHER